MLLLLFHFLNHVSVEHIIPRITNKKLNLLLSPTANTHVGLLQKIGAAGTSAKSGSLGKLSMKRQPNLFDSDFLKVLNEKGVIGKEVLLDGEALYFDGVPSDLENRYFRYQVDSFEEGKKNTFNLTYLEQCIKYNGKEWISLPGNP